MTQIMNDTKPRSNKYLTFLPTKSNVTNPNLPGQANASLYHDSGYALPYHLMQPAYEIKEMLLKPNKASMARVFKQIAHSCLTGEKRVCFKKQATLGLGCGRFEGKAIGRKQVGRLEEKLCDSFRLFDRARYHSEHSYDRVLNPFGTVVYLLLIGAVKFKPSEKMSQPKTKNVPTQFLRQSEINYLNTTSSDSKRREQKPRKINAIALKIEEKIGSTLQSLCDKFKFDIEFRKEHEEVAKVAKSQIAQIRQLLRKSE